MIKKFVFSIPVFVLFLVFNININAKKENNIDTTKINLFVGETTELVLAKNNINQKSDLLSIKQIGCEQEVCVYKIEAIKIGKTVLKDEETYEYHIDITNHNEKIKKSGLSKDEIYDIKIFELLQSFSISSMLEIEKLSEDKRDELFSKIEIIKRETFPENNYNTMERGNGGPGDVFLTTDSQTTSLIKHGHAGIGDGNGNVIEANPKRGVRKEMGNVEKYWKQCKKTTKRYTVIKATTAQKKKALSVAESKKGKPYGIVGTGDKYYFCTKLAWTAWDYSGAKNKIGHSWYASDMMKSKSLKLLETYHK